MRKAFNSGFGLPGLSFPARSAPAYHSRGNSNTQSFRYFPSKTPIRSIRAGLSCGRNPGAKLVCLDIQPNASSQAPERADVMNIGGFSDSVFEVIAAFADGTLRADQAAFVLPDEQTPRLGDDVVVRGRNPGNSPTNGQATCVAAVCAAAAPRAATASFTASLLAAPAFTVTLLDRRAELRDAEDALGSAAAKPGARFVLAYFTAASGVKVEYSSSENYEQQIVIDTEAGSPPDIAILPQPGLIADLVKKGFVTPLGEDTQAWMAENYAAGDSWVSLGSYAGPDGAKALYAFPYKDRKSVV